MKRRRVFFWGESYYKRQVRHLNPTKWTLELSVALFWKDNMSLESFVYKNDNSWTLWPYPGARCLLPMMPFICSRCQRPVETACFLFATFSTLHRNIIQVFSWPRLPSVKNPLNMTDDMGIFVHVCLTAVKPETWKDKKNNERWKKVKKKRRSPLPSSGI